MNKRDFLSDVISRWRSDYNFRTFLSAGGSFTLTVIFALYNGFLGIRYGSVWYGAICVYYIVLVVLRGLILIAEKKLSLRDDRGDAESKVYLAAACLLLLLNLSLIVPVSIMVIQQKPVLVTLVPAIAMAAHTTYKVTMASVHLKRRLRSADSLVRLLRTINFIDALVSILTLQNTLIMVNAAEDSREMLPLTAVTSAATLLAVLALSVIAIARGIRACRRSKAATGADAKN